MHGNLEQDYRADDLFSDTVGTVQTTKYVTVDQGRVSSFFLIQRKYALIPW